MLVTFGLLVCSVVVLIGFVIAVMWLTVNVSGWFLGLLVLVGLAALAAASEI